jgi:hypothetical protein
MLDVVKSSQSHGNAPKEEDGTYGYRRCQQKPGFLSA